MDRARQCLPAAVWTLVLLALLVLPLRILGDQNGRWSQYGAAQSLDSSRAEHAGWVPEPGGILYCVDLSVFYQTFYHNPRADWRYILGFEPAFMRAEDRAVYYGLCRSGNAIKACAPWVKRMTPADRLVLLAGPQTRPAFHQLEWFYAVPNTWVGRLPKTLSPPSPSTGRS